MANWFMSEWTGHLWVQQLQGFSSWLIQSGLASHACEGEMASPLTLFKALLYTPGLNIRRSWQAIKECPSGSRAASQGPLRTSACVRTGPWLPSADLQTGWPCVPRAPSFSLSWNQPVLVLFQRETHTTIKVSSNMQKEEWDLRGMFPRECRFILLTKNKY